MSKFPSKVEKYCAQNGIRLTSRRRQVLNELLASKKALSAYELVETCNNQNEKNISAMSIYRILQFLEEQHLAHKLNLANKYVACSHIMCDHEHDNSQFLICGECDKVKEINVSSSIMAALKTSIEKANFKLVAPQLEINCLCDPCNEKKIREKE